MVLRNISPICKIKTSQPLVDGAEESFRKGERVQFEESVEKRRKLAFLKNKFLILIINQISAFVVKIQTNVGLRLREPTFGRELESVSHLTLGSG